MYKVLIVEDDPMVASINKMYIEKNEQFNVTACISSVEEAIDFMENYFVDLIILDVFLPSLNGLELMKKVRDRKYDVDFILVTAANEIDKIDTALKYGAIDYLIKPFEFQRLNNALDNFISRKKLFSSGIVSQEALDQVTKVRSKESELPKGLNMMTLGRVLSQLSNEHWQPIGNIAENVDLSKVTVRRYLDYLVEVEKISVKMNYQTGGRPSYQYKLC